MGRLVLSLAMAVLILASYAQAATYNVTKAGRLVLTFEDKPGPVTSTALAAPDRKPLRNPFLSATALAPEEEDRLRGILARSRNVAEFIAQLKQAGYGVTTKNAPP